MFNVTLSTVIYTLSLHDALPISTKEERIADFIWANRIRREVLLLCEREKQEILQREQRSVSTSNQIKQDQEARDRDRKSTRLNSSHLGISYAVFCLKKKKNKQSI